jgi:hypothetical protein
MALPRRRLALEGGLEGRMPLDVGVKLGEGRFEVVRAPRFDHPPHSLDVLLRHRPLLKPGGFEGFLLGWEHRQVCDLPPVNVIGKRVGGLNFNPASLAPPVLHGEDKDPAPQVTHLSDLLAPFIPGAHPSGDDRVQLLVPQTSAAVRSGPGCIDDHVRVKVGQRTVGVSTVEGVVHPLHNLDVLLRHRPLSIPRERQPGA